MIWRHFDISRLTEEEYNYWFSLMDAKKQHKVLQYVNLATRKRTVVGEMLAREMIAEYCGIDQENILISVDERGKPFTENAHINFNISHSDDMVVCCISDKPVGIDVERVKPINPNIMKKLCTDSDMRYILNSENTDIPKLLSKDQQYRLYEIWTAKEAYFKCLGTGITNLKSISFSELINKRKLYNIEDYIVTII